MNFEFLSIKLQLEKQWRLILRFRKKLIVRFGTRKAAFLNSEISQLLIF